MNKIELTISFYADEDLQKHYQKLINQSSGTLHIAHLLPASLRNASGRIMEANFNAISSEITSGQGLTERIMTGLESNIRVCVQEMVEVKPGIKPIK